MMGHPKRGDILIYYVRRNHMGTDMNLGGNGMLSSEVKDEKA
jgi:hypothetical protein